MGVIQTKRDLAFARDDHWYRIPQAQMPRGVTTEYLAFFLSGKVFGEKSKAIQYYAPMRGLELVYRKDLIPDPKHPRANNVYYRVALGDLEAKTPPITNPTRRPISFIYTTWDRFYQAHTVADLYSTDDFFVDRIYYALRDHGVNPVRMWAAEHRSDPFAPGLKILCENGASVIASTGRVSGAYFLDAAANDDEILQAIFKQIASNGGAVTINIPSGE
ncbi:MAG: hypothetical protein IPO91_27375 [Chloroflexi bacterium]|uniref:hypothetical protein n=1 Tax=Candidatus Flexifilum breve TaxID=3140694 RepID=UPI0031360D9D|nr:hypothetical protein [Chloroflexota bacterium]MBK9750467.1 hypothetical protein [Chloroflexota bacterium]